MDGTEPKKESSSLRLGKALISKDFAPLGDKYYSPPSHVRQLRNRTVDSWVSGLAPTHFEAPWQNVSSLTMKLYISSLSEEHMKENAGCATALGPQNPVLDLQRQGGVQAGTADSDLQGRADSGKGAVSTTDLCLYLSTCFKQEEWLAVQLPGSSKALRGTAKQAFA